MSWRRKSVRGLRSESKGEVGCPIPCRAGTRNRCQKPSRKPNSRAIEKVYFKVINCVCDLLMHDLSLHVRVRSCRSAPRFEGLLSPLETGRRAARTAADVEGKVMHEQITHAIYYFEVHLL